MTRPHALCARCGARRDEHDAAYGPCSKTECKGFSDPYYAFYEGHGFGQWPTDFAAELYHLPRRRPEWISTWAYRALGLVIAAWLIWFLWRIWWER
jgi:hypothetical protein